MVVLPSPHPLTPHKNRIFIRAYTKRALSVLFSLDPEIKTPHLAHKM